MDNKLPDKVSAEKLFKELERRIDHGNLCACRNCYFYNYDLVQSLRRQKQDDECPNRIEKQITDEWVRNKIQSYEQESTSPVSALPVENYEPSSFEEVKRTIRLESLYKWNSMRWNDAD